jgi:hypothetical protein
MNFFIVPGEMGGSAGDPVFRSSKNQILEKCSQIG